MAMDATKVMERWSANTARSAPKYKDGVDAVTESPGETAANHISDYELGVMEALRSGKTERRMRAVSLVDWKRAATGRGATNLVTAANSADVKDHVRTALAQILPFTAEVKATVRRMPKGTREDRKARMLKAFEMMSGFHIDR